MRKYLYGKAALDRWDIPFFRGLIEEKLSVFPKEEIIFTDRQMYYSRKFRQIKCTRPEVEEFCHDGVASLPLLYLRAASEYSFNRYVLLGTQICAHRENAPPLCTLNELRHCAFKLYKFSGRKKALHALDYVRENSYSPMESILCLSLTLPNTCGGMGIPGLSMNFPIQLRKYKSKLFIADILHARTRSIIEFDSFEHHNNSDSFSRDSVRAADLESEGYKVISVKPKQVYDIKNYEVLMRNIARCVGKRIEIRTDRFIEGFIELREIYRGVYRNYVPLQRFIRRCEIPDFPGVDAMYQKYLDKWRAKR